MASRLELHEELCAILGSRNVYFQPPESVSMNYPCIRYSKSGVHQMRANNKNYKSTNEDEVIAIDTNPDSEISDKILKHFPMCKFDRPYVANNLYHFSLTLYY